MTFESVVFWKRDRYIHKIRIPEIECFRNLVRPLPPYQRRKRYSTECQQNQFRYCAINSSVFAGCTDFFENFQLHCWFRSHTTVRRSYTFIVSSIPEN